MAIRIPGLPLGPRMRKVAFYAGMVVLALVTYVFAVQATFPYDRVKDKLEQAAGSKYDLHIDDIERGIMPGVFYLDGVTLKTRPKPADLEKAYAITDKKQRDNAIAELTTTIYVERVKIDLGLLSAIRGIGSIDFDATFGDGSIHGNLTTSRAGTQVDVEGEDVPSEMLPMREALSNLPMRGEVNFEVALELPNEKLKNGKTGANWERAIAQARFECPAGCTIGDGKAKLKLKAKNKRQAAFAGEGTEFGTIRVGSLVAEAEIRDGKMAIQKFEMSSSDVELHVEYQMTLAQDLDDSVVLGCVRYKPSESLRKREPKTYDQILLIGGARAPDGLDNVLLTGPFKKMKKLARMCGPGTRDAGDPDRPNLTVHDDDDDEPRAPVITPPVGTSPPPPPPAAPVDAAPAPAPADAGVNVPEPGPEHEQDQLAPPYEGEAAERSGAEPPEQDTPAGEPAPAPEPEVR